MSRLIPLKPPAAVVGAKAARLALASRAGLPVLPGWVVPVAEARPALRAGAAAITAGDPAGARRAVLRHWFDADLAARLRAGALQLGGRVIARSSSPLEADARWSGAFSSVTGVGPDEAVIAVRSCWASAFAKDPQERLARCGLPQRALELAVLLQPEIRPDAGGVARVIGGEVEIEGVAGHPGPLLSGWAEGAFASVRPPAVSASPAPDPSSPAAGALADLIGAAAIVLVARLAWRVHEELGDNTIEWAIAGGEVWLLQSRHSAVTAARHPAGPASPADRGGPTGPAGRAAGSGPALAALLERAQMPFLAEHVLAAGSHVPSRPAVPGTAAGRLVPCLPHQPAPPGSQDAILLVDRPLPALAPLLFGARGLIARSGAAGSHLAEVARSLGVPMVTGCRPETVTGGRRPGTAWLAAIDGTIGVAAFLPA